MFYTYLRGLVVLLLWSINGNAHYHNTDKIPNQDENYILVAPHRTWWDPVYMAFATKPKQFIFMAKKELFTNRIFGWWIRMCGAFLLTVKILVLLPSNTLSMFSKKVIALSSCFQVGAVTQTMSRVELP